MARSHLVCFSLVGLVGAIGCGSNGGGTGGHGMGGQPGTGGETSSSSSSSSSASSSSSSSSSSSGASTSSSSSSSGTGGSGGTGGIGGAGTGGMGTGGMGGMGGGCQVIGSTCTDTAQCCGSVCFNGVCSDPTGVDQDGDGWTPLQGDCCDVPSANCQNPKLVNPGAFEYPGNGVDDDCNPSTPDNAPPTSCSAAAIFGGVMPEDLLRAMDLCQFADDVPATPKDKKWGVINGSPALLLADGVTALPAADNVQTGVMTSYGTYVTPQKYATMAAISSGTARAPADTGYVHPQNGGSGQVGNYNGNNHVPIQAGYLASHGGKPPSPASCSAAACTDTNTNCTTDAQCTNGNVCSGGKCKVCNQAFDSVNLRTRIRVPTNAQSFSYQFKFYSAEFPEYLCQQYNDFFIALLKSSWVPDPNANPPQQPLPADGNIAFDAQGNPVSVNNGFFQVCFPPFNAPPGTCPSGTLDLVGNGMGGWGTNLKDGGGTDWLTNTAPAVPGETIELQFIIWDAGDHNVDSLVLLDHFRWSVTPSTVGVFK